MNNTIPKIIHQIWIGDNSRPLLWMDTWQIDYIKKYPEWKYMLWTEKEIDQLDMKNKDLYLKESTMHGKADIVRYEILYNYGGVFVDADSVWIGGDLDDIINMGSSTGFVAAYETDQKNLVANGVIFVSKNNKIMLDLIKLLRIFYMDKRKTHEPFQVTGPHLITFINKLYPNSLTIIDHTFFYPIFWDKITDIEAHKKHSFPKNVYMFQYGYSTSNLKDKVDTYMQSNYNNQKIIEKFTNEHTSYTNYMFIIVTISFIILFIYFFIKLVF